MIFLLSSAIMMNQKRINYFRFISSLQNEDCNAALERITKRIDMKAIAEMIDAIPCIGDLQKRFYKTMLIERKERILDYSLERYRNRQKETTYTRKRSTLDSRDER